MLFFSGVASYAKCLTNVPTTSFSGDKSVNFQYPGQIWTPNDQCQQFFGSFSTFCQVCLKKQHLDFRYKIIYIAFILFSFIKPYAGMMCTYLYCRVSPSNSTCRNSVDNVMEGTTCGNGNVSEKNAINHIFLYIKIGIHSRYVSMPNV